MRPGLPPLLVGLATAGTLLAGTAVALDQRADERRDREQTALLAAEQAAVQEWRETLRPILPSVYDAVQPLYDGVWFDVGREDPLGVSGLVRGDVLAGEALPRLVDLRRVIGGVEAPPAAVERRDALLAGLDGFVEAAELLEQGAYSTGEDLDSGAAPLFDGLERLEQARSAWASGVHQAYPLELGERPEVPVATSTPRTPASVDRWLLDVGRLCALRALADDDVVPVDDGEAAAAQLAALFDGDRAALGELRTVARPSGLFDAGLDQQLTELESALGSAVAALTGEPPSSTAEADAVLRMLDDVVRARVDLADEVELAGSLSCAVWLDPLRLEPLEPEDGAGPAEEPGTLGT